MTDAETLDELISELEAIRDERGGDLEVHTKEVVDQGEYGIDIWFSRGVDIEYETYEDIVELK